ncbi:MAG: helix-turn-helix domain-containing protein, partial [Candidatus Jordarchaeaceae archaeon]
MAASLNQKVMEYVGLSEKEAQVYGTILLYGSLTPGEISVYTKLPISKVETLLEKLEKRKVIKKIPGVVVRYSAALLFKPLEETLEKFRKEAENFRKSINQKFNETLKEFENALNVWKLDVKTIIDAEIAKISNENIEAAKNLEQVSTQTSKTLEKETENRIKEISETIGKQSELYNDRISQYESDLSYILDTQIGKSEKDKEITEKDLIDKLNSYYKYYVGSIQSLNKSIQKKLSENSKTLLEIQKQMRLKNTELLEKGSVKFVELASETKNEAFSVLDRHQSTFSTDLKELLPTLDRSFQDIIKVREGNLDLFYGNIEKSILENAINNAKRLSNFHLSASKALNKLYKSQEISVHSTSGKLTELVNTGYSRALSVIERVGGSINEHLNTHIKELSREYREFQTEFLKSLDAENQNLITTSENLQKYYTDALEQQLNINTQTALTLKDKIRESLTKTTQEINTAFTAIQNNVHDTLSSEIVAHNNDLEGLRGAIFSLLDDSRTGLISSSQRVSENIFQSIDSEAKGFENNVKKIRKKFSE